MRRLASIISDKVERIPKYLDARRQQTEAMANPSSPGFLQKLDLLPAPSQAKLPAALLAAALLAAAPPPAAPQIEAAEKPAEGFFDKPGTLTDVAAPVAALMGEPEAAAAVTVIDEAVTKLQTVLAKPKADKAGKTDAAQTESAKATATTKASPPVRSRVEEVSASNEASPETPATNESEVVNATPDRSPQAWAARIRKMIEAETVAVERKLPEMPLVSAAQTQLAKTAGKIGDVSTTMASAIPSAAPLSAGLDEARRFVPPIADSGSLSPSVQQPIRQAVQQATAAIPFSMRAAANVESNIQSNISNVIAPDVEAGIEANATNVIAPIAETIESPVAQINQQLNQAGNQAINQATSALRQAASLPMNVAESVADFAGSITPRFVPPTLDAALPAQAISQSPLPNGVESLADDAIQSAAQSGEEFMTQSGLAAAAGGVSNEGLAGVAGSLFGQAQESIESSMSLPVETLEQWAQQAANPISGFAGLFGQAESSPTATAKSNRTETIAARGDNAEKIKTATRATSEQVAPDLDDIARQVYPILKRRLDAERRREFF